MDLRKEILEVIHAFNDEIPSDPSVDLLESGFVDSFDIANVVPELEERFHVEINAKDIVPENFNTVEHIAELVSKLKKER